MALWDRVKDELNRAGRVAQDAIDEGRLRLDLMRARQAQDRAARELGYAVYRARKNAGDLSADEYARFARDVASAEAEVERLETLIREASDKRRAPSATA